MIFGSFDLNRDFPGIAADGPFAVGLKTVD